MIVRGEGRNLIVTTQNDHADLAAQMAANWGNRRFSELEPFNEMVLGTALHDYGWHEWDSAPELDEATNKIANFNTLDPRRFTKFYTNGIAKVRELNQYAGLMDTMHAIGLYTQRYGFYPNSPNAKMRPAVREFLRKQKAMREEALEELRSGSMSEYASEEYIWHNYKMLQVFDILSLYLCWLLSSEYRISPVPTRIRKRDEELVVTRIGDSRIRIEPFPFKADPLRVCVQSRSLPNRTFKTNEELRKAYYEARKKPISFEITS